MILALGVVGARPHVRHASDADELLELLGDELGAIVTDDPRSVVGIFFPRPLDHDLHVALGHRLAQLPMDDEPAVAVEHARQVVERAGHVDV
jgi:hypothetical protein